MCIECYSGDAIDDDIVYPTRKTEKESKEKGETEISNEQIRAKPNQKWI